MSQNIPETEKPTGVHPYKNEIFEHYVTWRALAGLIVDEEFEDPDTGKITTNKLRQVSLKEFCDEFKVDRRTIWIWKNNTPDLAERIERRRNEIVPASRVSIAYTQLFLLGMQSQDKRAAVEALKTFLGHFGNLQTPVQREVHEVGEGFADLIQATRDKPAPKKEAAIEGEIVDNAINH